MHLKTPGHQPSERRAEMSIASEGKGLMVRRTEEPRRAGSSRALKMMVSGLLLKGEGSE